MISFQINNSMFIQARSTPESAWLGHIPFAAWLIEAASPRVLVELGTHHGASYLAFCQAVEASGSSTKCYAVDTWQGDEHAGAYSDDVFFRLLDNHNNLYGDFSRLLRMTFSQAVDYFSDGEVDVLHIDGFHTEDAVKTDFETWLPKLSDKAVVLFHDINVREREFGVWKYWEHIKQQYPYFEFTHTHGLGVLLVGVRPPEALSTLCEQTTSVESSVLINRLFDHLGRVITRTVDIGSLASQKLHLENEIYDCRAENDALKPQVLELSKSLTELELCRSEIDDQNAAIERLSRREAEFKIEMARSIAESAELEVQINKLRSSLSWRLTAPLRAIRRRFN